MIALKSRPRRSSSSSRATAALPVLALTDCRPYVQADARPLGTVKGRTSAQSAPLPKVIVIINTSYGDGEAILSGISKFQRDHGGWDVFVDDGAQAEMNPHYLADHPWDGVISRTTTARLVAEKFSSLRLSVRTPPFHGGESGSIPLGSASHWCEP